VNRSCNLCQRTLVVLPSGVTICITCDVTPTSTIPILRKAKP
jgi:hypothetical protein